MRQECIDAVNAAATRPLTAVEIQGIENRIVKNMRTLAQQDRVTWQNLNQSERLQRAGEAAAEELQREATLKKRRVALTILARQRLDEHINRYQGKFGKLEALNRTIAFHADNKSHFLSVESRAKATRNYALSQLEELFSAVDPRFFHIFEDKSGIRDLIFEMRGNDTGNVRAKKGAQAWRKVAELLRQRFNDAGGDIGYLEDWAMPQHHSMYKVGKASKNEWVSFVLGKIDRNRYVKENGDIMNETELTEFLGSAFETIATGGLNKLTKGGSGFGMRANRGSASRQIHFRDAQAWLDYHERFGEHGVWDILVKHIDGISKDIALVETYGPNPDHVFRELLKEVSEETATANVRLAGSTDRLRQKTENLYNFVAGKTQPVANPHIARWSENIRNWLVASRLGSALINSLSDNGTMYLTAKVNNLPMAQLLRNQLAAMNPANHEELRMARNAGLAMDTLIGSVNRWASDELGASGSRIVANTVMRASGLSAWSDAHKRAFGVTMMGGIGNLVRKHADLTKVAEEDARIIKSKGISDQDWKIWKLAEQEDWGGGNDTMLTPESIMRIPDTALKTFGNPERVRFEAMRKLLGAVTEEVDMAVISPGAREQMMTGAAKQRGTLSGELYRSLFLFKSFPIAVVMRHWSRALSMPSAGGRAAYLSAFLASTTVLGALSLQIDNAISGGNPREMDNYTFWLNAFLKGGGVGLYGDLLLSDHTRYGGGALASLQGPVVGLVDDVIKILQGVPLNAVEGKPEQTGGDLVKLAKGMIPGQNLWYTKAVVNHLMFNQMQEYFSPGYLRRMEKRARKEFNQTYWWRPQDRLPQ